MVDQVNKKEKILAITGANKGIGLSIIDNLMRNKIQYYTILLCTRTIENGEKAKKDLIEKYKELADVVRIVQLDIGDDKSISSFIDLVKKDYNGKLTCLVNNAGTAFKGDAFDTHVFDVTFSTNVFNTIKFTNSILSNDLIENKGKIIIVGSTAGKYCRLSNEELINRFKDTSLTEDKILQLAQEFRGSIEKGNTDKDGWGKNIYCISKLCINRFAYILAHEKNILDKEIQVYSCCPGWVKTDMGGPNAPGTLEEGSETPSYLVNLKYELNKDIQGQFFYQKKVHEL